MVYRSPSPGGGSVISKSSKKSRVGISRLRCPAAIARRRRLVDDAPKRPAEDINAIPLL